MPQPERIRVHRNLRAIIIGTAVLLFIAFGFVLPFLMRGTETFFGKIRYTSICTRCGSQMAADFYFVLDSEIAHSRQILPMSRQTIMPHRAPSACAHDYALVGKSIFNMGIEGRIMRQVSGQPSGDCEFAKAEVKNTFLALSRTNSSEASAFIENLARQRYRGQPLAKMQR